MGVPFLNKTLGPYRIASALLKVGYTVKVIDNLQVLSAKECMRVIDNHISKETLWIGYSSTFMVGKENDDKLLEVYEFIKKKTNAKIVYGGGGVDENDFDSKVDYYVSGYSDNSIIALTDYIEIGRAHV